MDDEEFQQFAENINKQYDDENNIESSVKHEITSDEAEEVKCSFCPETVSTKDIVSHTQMHTLEWEKEDDPDESDPDDTDDEDTKVEMSDISEETAKKLPDGEIINCSLCQQDVPKLTIYEHTYQHMFAKRKMHPCHLCDKTYRDKNQLSMHLMVHTGEKPFQCDRCEKSFRLAQSLKNHINIHHTKSNLETCDQCGETFTYKKGLMGHLSKMHGIETGWKCDKCGERFMTEAGMESHDKLDSCYKLCCTDCGKMFKRASLLEKHREIHSDKEHNYHCDQCGKDFPTPEALKRHTILHLNLRQFQCFCGKAFNRKDGLRAHEKTHNHKNPKYDVREKGANQVPSEVPALVPSQVPALVSDQREVWQRQQEQQHLHWLHGVHGLGEYKGHQ